MTGPANFRDLGGMTLPGGLRLRHRRLLRSSTFAALDEEALTGMVSELGPGLYFDLRTDWEVERDGDLGLLSSLGWALIRIPLADEAAPRGRLGAEGEACPPAAAFYRKAASSIASRLSAELPNVIACSLGKDRTGYVIALLLAWLGASPRAIAADFAASNDSLKNGAARLLPRWRGEGAYSPVEPDACLALLRSAGSPAISCPVPPGLLE